MKITNNLYIKSLNFNQQHKNNRHQNLQNPIIGNTPKMFAYNDFMVNFTGRTPEDFYAQDFNRNNMPDRMKNYLYYDYEQRRHIPPEQMMQEVFKYIKDAKSLEEVKKSGEPLFKNLHKVTKNSRTGILSEIKIAKELSNTSLFKDGSDDFGIYLLKKIYTEGKTIKEINKDFYEKDLNDEYKGIMTQPISYETTSAYGIKFPKTDFWHSFIATRDEYKKFFVTLPKDTVDPNRTGLAHSFSSGRKTTSADNPGNAMPAPRKYRIKQHKTNEIKRDIKNSDGSTEQIEKIIKRRFTKDDPEASFIVKYLSPIMTVAAEKVHLSEEEKDFAQYEKDYGNTGKGKTMFERFWKANSALRENYSTAITDTIEMFEEVYGGGGMIPINNNFEVISSATDNQKIIDFVLPEFIELLNYTQTIAPEREKRYAEHDLQQAQWEKHFLERYGEVKTEEVPPAVLEEVKNEATANNIDEVLKTAANKNGAKIYKFKLSNGTTISLASNVEEMLKQKIALEYRDMPPVFVRKYTKFILNHPKATEDYLLSFACNTNNMENWGNFIINDDNYTDEELAALNKKVIQEIKSQMISEDEVFKTINEIYNEFEEKNPDFIKLVKHSIMEYSTRLKTPDNDYIKQLIDTRYKNMEKLGFIPKNLSEEEKLAEYTSVYKQTTDAIRSMKNHNIVYLSTKSLEAGLLFLSIGNYKDNQNNEIEQIMQKYKTPLTNSEKNKITIEFMNLMYNMKPEETESFKDDLSGFYLAVIAGLKNPRFKKSFIEILNKYIITSDSKTLRYLIDKNADKNLKSAMVEIEISQLMQRNMELFKMLASYDVDIMNKYIRPTNPNLYNMLLAYRQKSVIAHLLSKK